MRAAVVVRANELEFREVPVPKRGPYQALVRIEACAICNATDVKIFHARLPFVRADSYPGILGHEAVGTVIEADAKAKAFPVGARVLRPWAQVPGLGSFWGGFAEYGLVTDMAAAAADGQEPAPPIHRGMQLVPPDIEPALATQLVTWKECLSYLTGLQVGDAEQVLVMGTGPVGLAMCALARKVFRVPDVVCLGRREVGLERARKLGATATVNTAEVEAYAALRALASEGFDVVLDAAGDAGLVRLGLQVLKPQGRLGAYATEDSDKAPWLATTTDSRVYRGGCDESTAHDQALELARDGTLDLRALITHTLPFDQLLEGLRLVETRTALKVVTTIGA